MERTKAVLHNSFVLLAFDEARNAPEETTDAHHLLRSVQHHPLRHRLRAPCSSPRLRQPAAPGRRRRPRGGSTRPYGLSSVRYRLTRLHRPRRTVHRRLRCVSVRAGDARLQPRAGRPRSSRSGRMVVARVCGSSRLITPSSRAVAFSGSHPRRLWALCWTATTPSSRRSRPNRGWK